MKRVIQQIINAFCGALPLLLCSAKSQSDPKWEALLLIPIVIIVIIGAFFFQKFWKKYIIKGGMRFLERLKNS